ncbi:DUF2125 domain-containing protein [Marivita sp. S2033]|uniref:DUF2125 domain-containing protein n=1 Tax=Marivita sp. S2033 TaxID=3373187 RepID=UPI003981C34A
MKRLFAAILVATLGYCAWWFYAAHTMRVSVENWFQAQRDQGWTAEYQDLEIRGFPNRTDLTVTGPLLRSPDGQHGWQAPFFQVLSLSYNHAHVIVAWADTQTLFTPSGEVSVGSDGLRASVVREHTQFLRSNVEASVLNLTLPDHSIALAGVNAALHKVEPSDASYRLALTVDGIALPDLPNSGGLAPESLSNLRADTVVTLSGPLNGSANPAARLTHLAVRHSEISYGALTLRITGDADIDPLGYPTGTVTIKADNWRESLNAAREKGDLPPALSDGVIDMLTLLSGLSGSRDALDVTLGLTSGAVFLGPLKIGQLPPLLLR